MLCQYTCCIGSCIKCSFTKKIKEVGKNKSCKIFSLSKQVFSYFHTEKIMIIFNLEMTGRRLMGYVVIFTFSGTLGKDNLNTPTLVESFSWYYLICILCIWGVDDLTTPPPLTTLILSFCPIVFYLNMFLSLYFFYCNNMSAALVIPFEELVILMSILSILYILSIHHNHSIITLKSISNLHIIHQN